MDEPKDKPRRAGLITGILLGRGKWYWMLLRLAVVAALIVAFRYQVLAWVALGHNAAWKAATGSEENHAGDVILLLRLRGPGVAALLRIGEEEALARARDPAMVPELADIVQTHPDPQVRRAALAGLAQWSGERALSAVAHALSDPEPGIRALAAHALGDQGDARHLPALRAAAEREIDPEVRQAIQLAIRALPPTPPAPDAPLPPERERGGLSPQAD